MSNNETFIRIYENAIDLNVCDEITEQFESNSEQHERMNTKDIKKQDNGSYSRGGMLFDELHFLKYMNTWKDEIIQLANIFTKYVNEYKLEFSDYPFPKKHGFEPFKMKRYLPNGEDEFGWHVDVRSFKNMRRFLAMFVYLSDNKEGKTEFSYQKTTTNCKKGSMVIFPPAWPWLHRGTKPIETPKYFMGTYLHYVE